MVKQTITIFIEKKFVDAAGGPDVLKAFLYQQAVSDTARLSNQAGPTGPDIPVVQSA